MHDHNLQRVAPRDGRSHPSRRSGPLLYPYQRQLIEKTDRAFERHRGVILQAPTAAGKTVVFAEMIRRFADLRILVLVHRRELIRQAATKLTDAGVEHGIIAPGFDPQPAALVQVMSIQTAARRGVADYDFIVVDECHHAPAATWRDVIDKLPEAKVLGLSATPGRLDGKGLGIAHGGPFSAMVCGPAIGELIELGFLSRVRCFAPPQQIDASRVGTKRGDFELSGLAAASDCAVITGDAVDEYRRRADHKPALAFCVTVEHAEHAAKEFRSAGYRADCVHGGLLTRERDRLIAGLGTGEVEVLASCEILGEGIDVPSIGAVIMLRPTMSLTVYLQQVGRGMRMTPGKLPLVVLDHAANVLRHGLPDFERIWTLDGVVQQPGGEARVKTCPGCSLIVAVGTRTCPCCGHLFFSTRLETRAGTLTEISSNEMLLHLSYGEITKLRLSEDQLRLYAEARGYKPGWVWHRLREQQSLAGAGR